MLSVFQDAASWSQVNMKPDHPLMQQQQQQTDLQQATGQDWSTVAQAMDIDDDDGDEASSSASTKLNARDMKTFGNMPMEDEAMIVTCNNCKRVILATSFTDHLSSCMPEKVKQRQGADTSKNSKKPAAEAFFSDNDDYEDDMGSTKTKKKKAIKQEDTTGTNNMKRPPPADKLETKKKTKKEKTKKGSKQKAPLDLDKQCGVITAPNTTPCTRSLTCKSHAMGAKRAVAGRSQPYDVLLAAYQKKAIGRPQTANASSATPPTSSTTSAPPVKQSLKVKKAATTPAVGSTSTATPNPNNNDQDCVDSDEEVEHVLHALRASHPIPLAQRPHFYVRRQRKTYRLHDILLDAITPKDAAAATEVPTAAPVAAPMSNAPAYPSSTINLLASNANNAYNLHTNVAGFPMYNMDNITPSSPSNSSMVSAYSMR
ncbi:SCA7, zinc-binding domain-containing protein [Gongronella butleri]|nr:SCA7, zinc-binding domain-containing protein [Gongronella butleri]